MPKNRNSTIRKTLYTGKFVKVIHESHIVAGKAQFSREIISENEGVLIIVTNEEDQICLIKQRRGAQDYQYELPAGAIKKGETPLQAAQRELREETGLVARHWKLLSRQTNGANSEGDNYYFSAKVTKAKSMLGSTQLDADEDIISIEFFNLKQALLISLSTHMRDLRNKAGIWLGVVTQLEQSV
jgi:ADP-ribose pyrophosphatase